MTVINQAELAKLTHLDQVLMWSIISINASNLDPRNNNISDNAAIREESRDYISWKVVQGDKWTGKFTFTALLPIVNPKPLQNKNSIIERVWSYSPFELSTGMNLDIDYNGIGFELPNLPSWTNTTERLLAFCAILGTKISVLSRLLSGSESQMAIINPDLWADCQYSITDSAYGSQMSITGYLTIDWQKYIQGDNLIRCLIPHIQTASEMNCNFPDLRNTWGSPFSDIYNSNMESLIKFVPSGDYNTSGAMSDLDTGAESLIDSYSQKYYSDDALPDWYKDAIDNPPQLQDFLGGIGNVSSSDAQAPKLIESLPICKEQDSSVVNYGKSPLATVLSK